MSLTIKISFLGVNVFSKCVFTVFGRNVIDSLENLAIGGFKVVSDVSKHSMRALLLDHERF